MKKKNLIYQSSYCPSVKSDIKKIEEDVIFGIVHIIDNVFQILSFLMYFNQKTRKYAKGQLFCQKLK